jgi:hypothetical protein
MAMQKYRNLHPIELFSPNTTKAKAKARQTFILETTAHQMKRNVNKPGALYSWLR